MRLKKQITHITAKENNSTKRELNPCSIRSFKIQLRIQYGILQFYALIKKREMQKAGHGPTLILLFSLTDSCDPEVIDFFVLHLISLQIIHLPIVQCERKPE